MKDYPRGTGGLIASVGTGLVAIAIFVLVSFSRYKGAVIWCRRFTVGFGVAGLS